MPPFFYTLYNQVSTKRNLMTDTEQLFVLNGILVRKTGRTAQRDVEKQTLRKTTTYKELIVEVLPVDTEDGIWKRWVSESELFKVD